ncbi:MAG TPA: hypothetical protein VNI20_11570, partial [Fimbriimonadaceae bacterium]|nr:hypothetical protein [Fimbriimonadaceae bacterium]
GLAVLFTSLFVISGQYREGYFLSPFGWSVVTVFGILVACAFATEDMGWNLLWAWAMVSVTAPYFPALFQRKLSMMLAVPWAIIGAIGLARELERRDRQPRNLVAALTLCVVCLTSVFWLKRDLSLVRAGVSRTLAHNLVLTHDESRIIAYLDKNANGAGVLAMPGVPGKVQGDRAYLNDLAPVLSGLAGVHTFAGHWSETPEYNMRRTDATAFFVYPIPTERRLQLLKQWRVSYVVVPKKETYSELPLVDIKGIGQTVYDGIQLSLVKVEQD